MNEEAVDTNVILRFLVGDDPSQQELASKWFAEAEAGTRKLTVVSLVIAECCFTLESFYKQPRQDICSSMQVFLSQRWLKIPERDVLIGLLPDYAGGLHFVDSYLLSLASHNEGAVLTFDRQMNREQKAVSK